MAENAIGGLERATIGALGGFAAVLVKFLGQDYDTVLQHASSMPPDLILSYKVGYGILTPILMFLGSLIAWVSDDKSRLRLIGLAISAPAMITTWAGGHKTGESAISMVTFFVPSAVAQPAPSAQPSNQPSSGASFSDRTPAPQEQSTWQTIQKGVGVFFGYDKEPPRYWVIVSSLKSEQEAQQMAEALNKADPTLDAWVGVKVPPNEYYPVGVGDYSTVAEARVLEKRARATGLVKEAYLSPGAKR